ncbi:MAG: triose-phosphate isomerase [Candidatus Saccharibacteria bacterium]|nr:triose-phosphate isomerase [Candidatus Saccharibacteria bacterium]
MTSPRKTYIIANWKMNFTPGESSLYLNRLSKRITPSRSVQVILAPSTVSLQPLSLQINRRQFKLAAQNFYWRDYGAFTGETSVSQLRGFVDYAIVGHSERRYIFNESEEDIAQKVAAALRNGLTPILCIGETAMERKDGETAAAIYSQLANGLHEVSKEDISKIIIAYEPVWAISSNKNARPAKPADIEEAQALIRKHISKLYGKTAGEEIPVLYGGSVNSNTAGGYLSIKGIDGLLIGGASLIADSFCAIVETAKGIKNE